MTAPNVAVPNVLATRYAGPDLAGGAVQPRHAVGELGPALLGEHPRERAREHVGLAGHVRTAARRRGGGNPGHRGPGR